MTGVALARNDTLLPRAPGGQVPGALLALAVHAALAAALTVSVDWRSQPTDVVAAELWASVPQTAAPPPPPPAPPAAVVQPEPRVAAPPPPAATPPREADIATERADRRKAEAEKRKREELAETERRKAEADKKKRDDEAREAREAAAQEKRAEKERLAMLSRIMGQAASAADGRTGTAAQDAAPSAAYAGRVAALIRRSSVFTGSVPGNPATEVEVRAAASGTILSRRVVKSSGHKAWDDAVLQAIDKAGTLPRDSDGRVPSQIIIAFRPKDE